MDGLRSRAMVTVSLEKKAGTVRDVRDWLAEVERLHLPEGTVLEECFLSVTVLSDVLDSIWSESELGVAGNDILVGLPR